MDLSPPESWFLPGADDERCDGSCGGLGQESGALCRPVDVILLDGDRHLRQKVVGRAVGGEYQVRLVQLVSV